MYICSHIYKQFKCIGSDCRNTCCSGWGLSFDSDIVDYYNQLEGEFGEFIRQNMYWSEKNGLTLVKMSDRRECPFLNSKGLCRICIECGEQHMSETCRIFPWTKFDLSGLRSLSAGVWRFFRMELFRLA